MNTSVEGITISTNGTFIVNNEIIRKVVDWFYIPGTSEVFFNYRKKQLKLPFYKRLSDQDECEVRRNTLRGKIAEICEHARLNIPINWELVLRSDITGDGGVDIIHNFMEIDVKSRDGYNFGFSISEYLFKDEKFDNRIFSGHTAIYPEYNKPINELLDHMEYEHTGMIFGRDLRVLRDNNELDKKFKGSLEAKAIYFKQKQIGDSFV